MFGNNNEGSKKLPPHIIPNFCRKGMHHTSDDGTTRMPRHLIPNFSMEELGTEQQEGQCLKVDSCSSLEEILPTLKEGMRKRAHDQTNPSKKKKKSLKR